MHESANFSTQRMRPALGTFVEIAATGRSSRTVTTAITQAFDEIAQVEQLMSFHQPHSDIGRINRSQTAIEIHPWTARVIHLAMNLAGRSTHRFNPTVGGQLVRRGRLPDPAVAFIDHGTIDDIELIGTTLYRRRPVLLTLDGIAKGWAVDRAIARLRACGVTDAVVNAGGDWRCFGTPQMIRIHSGAGCQSLGQIENGACATSAAGHDTARFPAQLMANGAPVPDGQWTVIAGKAWLADGLTKVAAATPAQAAREQISQLGGQLLHREHQPIVLKTA